jgi:ActR/RegA family two-component response regulator
VRPSSGRLLASDLAYHRAKGLESHGAFIVKTDTPRVIVCEDDFLLAGTLTDALTQLGCTVVACVGTVAGALRAVEAGSCEFAVVDIDLRGTPAHAVLDALVALGIPFIVATSAAIQDMPPRHAHCPLLAKPYALDALRDAMQAIGQ